jgi:hypothetical protein
LPKGRIAFVACEAERYAQENKQIYFPIIAKEVAMLSKKMFGEMRRAGMNVGLSKAKLSQAMLEILIQLPMGTTNLKETIVVHMGLLGQMSATRDINEAWNQTKKKAASEYPEKFMLDGRKVLHWNDGSIKVLDKKISSANFKKLNDLAEQENCAVNQIVSKLIRYYQKGQG